VYQNDTLTSLGTLHGDGEWFAGFPAYSLAFGINDAGDMVGESDGTAFIYRNGVMADLNTLVPAGSPHLGRARAINDLGQIVGLVWTSPCGHAFLITPVPGQ
jgi:probable HAF family extracellular repeat protein